MSPVAITQIYQTVYLHILLQITMTCHQQLVTLLWLVSTSPVLRLDKSLT